VEQAGEVRIAAMATSSCLKRPTREADSYQAYGQTCQVEIYEQSENLSDRTGIDPIMSRSKPAVDALLAYTPTTHNPAGQRWSSMDFTMSVEDFIMSIIDTQEYVMDIRRGKTWT